LQKCLKSSLPEARLVVYVDSGSTDGSVEMARETGVDVVELDQRLPFTAARARNAGFARLAELAPHLKFVQFVDGDCELVEGWLAAAGKFLSENGDVAAVCGRLREKYPSRSIYNLLCDIEWDTPVGEAKACGGIAMIRAEAFGGMQGFRSSLIAGEEPELCVRLRASGWRIWRLDHEMALHDAEMLRFVQWWWRSVRTGYAYAEGARLHGAPPERHGVRESRSAWFWGFAIPVGIAGWCISMGGWGLVFLLVYPLQVVRLAMRGGRLARENWCCAVFLVLGKFAQVQGQVRYMLYRYLGRHTRLIEYK